MVNQAIHKYGNVEARLEFLREDIRKFRTTRRFDVALSLFHVISYQVTDEDLMSAFAAAREHMLPEGIFIFDVWYGPAVLSDRPRVRVKRMKNASTTVVRIAEPIHDVNENTVQVNYTIQTREDSSGMVREIEEAHLLRYFFLPEIRAMLARSGLRLINAHGWLSQEPLSDKTWSACIIAKKE